MDADLLLRWMSETGEGGVRDLRERVAWMSRRADMRSDRKATGRWIRDVFHAGHAEVDWSLDRWSITPPTICRLPRADGTAVLVGDRRVLVTRALDECDLGASTIPAEPSGNDLPAPSTIFLQYDDPGQLADLAAEVRGTYAGCAATRLAQHLEPARLGTPAAAPARSNETFRHRGHSGWEPVSPTLPPGLYRYSRHGQFVHLYREGGEWRHCELAEGRFADLARRRESVMRWRPETAPGRSGAGTLYIDQGAPLPAAQARALILCSGLGPRFSAQAQTASYCNVPREVARDVARSLGQVLEHA